MRRLVLCVLVCGLLAACGPAPAPTPAPVPAAPPVTLQGTGGGTTAPFTLTAPAYTVAWAVTDPRPDCHILAFLNSVDATPIRQALVVDSPGPTGTAALANIAPGRYVLVLSTACAHWTVTLTP